MLLLLAAVPESPRAALAALERYGKTPPCTPQARYQHREGRKNQLAFHVVHLKG
jgi:hypothetical protein